jgi:hypothetical protein
MGEWVMEQWCNNTDRGGGGGPKYGGEAPYRSHFFLHKSYKDWPGIVPGLPRLEAGYWMAAGPWQGPLRADGDKTRHTSGPGNLCYRNFKITLS